MRLEYEHISPRLALTVPGSGTALSCDAKAPYQPYLLLWSDHRHVPGGSLHTLGTRHQPVSASLFIGGSGVQIIRLLAIDDLPQSPLSQYPLCRLTPHRWPLIQDQNSDGRLFMTFSNARRHEKAHRA